MPRIRFTNLFAERIGGVNSVDVLATTVESALRALTDRHPPLMPLVWAKDGALNPVMVVFLNDRQLVDSSSAALAAALAEAAGDRRDQTLILRADRETPHHFVVTAMDVAAQCGFTNLSIAADRTAGPAE